MIRKLLLKLLETEKSGRDKKSTTDTSRKEKEEEQFIIPPSSLSMSNFRK
ncbi:hypothetical protein HYT52_00420 [Candidatus Woesearchaeota archaeon]|nr:hypothetical protein [Candidatus Woesearchaeota archaeon]